MIQIKTPLLRRAFLLLKRLKYSLESAHFVVTPVYGAAAYALDIFHTRYDLGLVLVFVARILEPLRTHAREDFLQRDVFDRVQQCRHDDAIRCGSRSASAVATGNRDTIGDNDQAGQS